MDIERYKNFLLTHLPNARLVSGGKEVNCKCMYCDDKHTHMYIKIPQTPNEASMFNCFRCPAQGVVTPTTLNEWNCYNDSIAIDLINHNKNIKFIPQNGRDVRQLSYWSVSLPLGFDKLNYLNNRLGTSLTIMDCIKMKICLNFEDIILQNDIVEFTRNYNDISALSKYFIGFISLDNSFINFRRIVDEGIVPTSIDERYINYNIFNKIDNTERFYTIPIKIDMNNTSRIKIHITEGPFDCLSVYYNVRNQENGIYTCIAGNNYTGIVRRFILAIGFHYSEIHIYPDNDKSGNDYKMKSISEICKPLDIPVYIHRNTFPGEKDFGVPRERIQETIYQIK